MKREDKEKLFLSETVFIERWVVQLELDSDLNTSIKRMNERIGWLNKQLTELATQPQEQDVSAEEIAESLISIMWGGVEYIRKDAQQKCYPEEFVEWITNAQLYFRDGYEMTLQGVYKYWLTNIKDK